MRVLFSMTDCLLPPTLWRVSHRMFLCVSLVTRHSAVVTRGNSAKGISQPWGAGPTCASHHISALPSKVLDLFVIYQSHLGATPVSGPPKQQPSAHVSCTTHPVKEGMLEMLSLRLNHPSPNATIRGRAVLTAQECENSVSRKGLEA